MELEQQKCGKMDVTVSWDKNGSSTLRMSRINVQVGTDTGANVINKVDRMNTRNSFIFIIGLQSRMGT